MDNVTLGFPSVKILAEARSMKVSVEDFLFKGSTIGDDSIIRPYTTIYCNVIAGNGFKTGHNVMIREWALIGDNVFVGTNSVIDGNVLIGDNVNIQSNVYIPPAPSSRTTCSSARARC